MKRKHWFGIVLVAFGLLIAIGPRTIFPVCPMGEMAMRCAGTAQAALWTGLAIAALGAAQALLPQALVGAALSALAGVGGLLTILYPTVLIGVCKMPTMACHALTLPALVILGSFTIAAAALNVVLSIPVWKKVAGAAR